MSTTKTTKNYRQYQPGFTLIELMIVVVIVGVIAAIAYPLYTDYVRNSRRTEATTMLLQISGRQERFFLDNKRYASNMTNMGYSAANELSPHGYYLASVTTAGINGYIIQAVPQAKGGQNSDTDCAAIIFEHDGATAGGIKTPAVCWKQ